MGIGLNHVALYTLNKMSGFTVKKQKKRIFGAISSTTMNVICSTLKYFGFQSKPERYAVLFYGFIRAIMLVSKCYISSIAIPHPPKNVWVFNIRRTELEQ